MKSNKEVRKDNLQFRILSVIAIILVIAGHCGLNSLTLNGLFNFDSFHIPLFVFISGYFFSTNISINDAKYYFLKKTKKFLIPFFFWNIIYGILAYFLYHYFGIWYNNGTLLYKMFIAPFTKGNCFFGFNDPSWFLLMLYNVEIFDYFLRLVLNKFKYKQYYLLVISFCLSVGAVYFATSFNNADKYMIITRMLYMVLFFECGSVYKNYIEKHDVINNTIYFATIILIQLILIFSCGYNGTVAGIWNSRFSNSGLTSILLALNGIAFYLRISRLLVPIILQNKLVNYISKNTLTIMMHHVLGFFITNCIWYFISLHTLIVNFDVQLFKTQLWYKTLPYNNETFTIIYLIMGIAVPLILHNFFSKLKAKLKLDIKHYLIKNNSLN